MRNIAEGIRLQHILERDKREGNSKTEAKKCQHHQHKIMTLALCSIDEVNQGDSVGEGGWIRQLRDEWEGG